MKPRCGKILLKLQVPCDRPAGHTGKCRKIDLVKQNAWAAAWGAANPERKAANSAAWQKANPERMATHNAAWRAANPERSAAINAAWAKNNPERKATSNQKRRAAKAGAAAEPFTKTQYIARMASFGNVCYYGALIGEDCPHECDDHVFPIEPRKGHKPGPHAIRNLVPSCHKHNKQKHNKPPMDFITKLLETP